MTEKYTPGPWEKGGCPGTIVKKITESRFKIIADEIGPEDMGILLAAPALFAACEAARHELTTLHGLIARDGGDPTYEWEINTTKLLAVLDAAIAKARGE